MHSKLFVGIYFALANSSLKRFSRHKQWAQGIVALVGSLFFIFCFCSCFVLLLSFVLFCSFCWKKIDNKPISKYVTYHQVVLSTKEKLTRMMNQNVKCGTVDTSFPQQPSLTYTNNLETRQAVYLDLVTSGCLWMRSLMGLVAYGIGVPPTPLIHILGTGLQAC